MPVQINEVVIRVVVGENHSSASNPTLPNHDNTHSMTEALLVERIMEIIKSKKER